MIKIAKPFVDALHDETDAALVHALIALADSLGLRTVAEGIKDSEQLARLCDLDCTLGQGYLFARPLAPDRFHQKAARRPGACRLSHDGAGLRRRLGGRAAFQRPLAHVERDAGSTPPRCMEAVA